MSRLSHPPARNPQSLYSLQVRAFLQAAEDVYIDPETVADILDGFNNDLDELSSTEAGSSESEESLEELDISAICQSLKERKPSPSSISENGLGGALQLAHTALSMRQ
jgi:hypothetical protein